MTCEKTQGYRLHVHWRRRPDGRNLPCPFIFHMRASNCCGLSRCGSQAPEARAQRPWLTGPAASASCAISPGRATNLCTPLRQADSQTLRHQGSPKFCISLPLAHVAGHLEHSRWHPRPCEDTEELQAPVFRLETSRPGCTSRSLRVCRVRGNKLHSSLGQLDFVSTPRAPGSPLSHVLRATEVFLIALI